MRIEEVLVDWIFGFSVGFSFAPIGDAHDEEGYIIIDLGVMRFIVVYS